MSGRKAKLARKNAEERIRMGDEQPKKVAPPLRLTQSRNERRTQERTKSVKIPPQIERSMMARHEVAHAVVAHAQGIHIDCITIIEDEAQEMTRNGPYDDIIGGCMHDLGTPEENARIASAPRPQDLDDEENIRKLIPGLEFVRAGEHNDDVNFKYWATVAAGGDPERGRASSGRLIQEAATILDERIDAANKLTAALLERGRLDEAEVLSILGPYPEVSPETLTEREATKAAHSGKAHDQDSDD